MTTRTPAPPRPSPDPGAPRGRVVPERDAAPGPDPRWARPGLLVLLAVTAVTYLWDLGASGWANSYYAAAVQAGSLSAKALLFGSLDPNNVITVDKPPAALWVMGLSTRIFGFSPWSVLVPQALMGVASVALLHAAVRRWSGPGAALTAAAVLAFTPAAVLIFRFDNPDALLVLLMTAACYAGVRAVDSAAGRSGTRWLLLAGVLVGFGFLTKMLQVVLVVPALAGTYLLVAPVGWRRRIGQLLGAGVAVVVSAGWYVALVELWPVSSRPWIGGSTGNSLLELALGYNGLSRILGGAGNGTGGGGGPGPGGPGGPGGGGFGGTTGILRMANTDFGGNISWLLPAALLVLLAGLWVTRRAPRTDRTRAGLVLWGGWLVTTGLVFSFMSGTIHPYYVVAMAPALGGTLAAGLATVWARRGHLAARLTLVVALSGTVAWSVVLLDRAADLQPWLRVALPVAGALAAVGLLVSPGGGGWRRRVGALAVPLAVLAGAGGVTAWAAATALTPHQGSIVSAGPATGTGPFSGGPGGGGGQGGPGSTSTDPAVVELLRSAGTTWSAATVGAQSAAGLQLSTGTAVMSIGGFTGSDQAPTLARFQAWVARGAVHYLVSGGGPGGGHGSPAGGGRGGHDGVGGQISTWVAAHYRAETVGGLTVYDLTSAPR